MITSQIVYEGNLRTRSVHARSQQQIITDASKTCPVALSLHPDIKQNVIFHFL
jgi:hypothetical protein